jgi:hypothetical protein
MPSNNVFIHYADVVGTIRVYEQADGYQNRQQFFAIIDAVWLSDATVQLQGGHGALTRPAIIAIAKALYHKGATQALIHRPHGKRMPFAKFLYRSEAEDTYAVDLALMHETGLFN